MSRLKRLYWMWRIHGFHILDRDYFAILAGRTFATDLHAIWYYLCNADVAERGLSLNPLIEADWVRSSAPGSDASWYAILNRSEVLLPTSPGFDGERYANELRGAWRPRTTAAALRHFLRTATASTTMPMHESARGPAPTWGEYRARAVDVAARYVAQHRRHRPRTSEVWSQSGEREFSSSIAAISDVDVANYTVSVILVVGSDSPALRSTIDSVRSQTFTSWELIVVDDEMTDEAAEVVSGIASTDDRVRVVRADRPGLWAARNCGLSVSKAAVVGFLDFDSRWLPGFLELALKGMAHGGAQFVHCGVRLVGDHGAERYRGMAYTRDDLLYAGGAIDLTAALITRSLLELTQGFDEELSRGSDDDLFLELTRYAAPAYLPFLGVERDDRREPHGAALAGAPGWQDVVVGRQLMDWTALQAAAGARTRGLVSVIIPTFGDWTRTAAAVRAVVDHSGARAVEVIVVDNGSRRHVSAILRGLFGSLSNLTVLRMPRNLNFALGNNVGLSHTTGEFVVTLNNDTEVTEHWLEPLLHPVMHDSTVLASQPLLVFPDAAVQTAGTVFVDDDLPRHFLAGYPVAEAMAAPPADYSAITAAALCIRAADLIELRGFDPSFVNGLEDVDLCLRGTRAHPGTGYRVMRESVVLHWEGQSPNRSRAAEQNRHLFRQRWGGSYPPSDRWRFEALGLPVERD